MPLVLRRWSALAASLALASVPAPAAVADPPVGRTMAEVRAAAAPADWRPLDPESTLYLELDRRRVIIELAPRFAPEHAANIRQLARRCRRTMLRRSSHAHAAARIPDCDTASCEAI